MKSSIFLPSILLSAVLIYLPSQGSSEKPAGETSETSTQANKVVVTLTDSETTPKALTLKKGDLITFTVAQSAKSTPMIEIAFHEHGENCVPQNFGLSPEGKIESETALASSNPATTCFRDAGQYAFMVKGLQSNPAGVSGIITVE